MRQLGLFIKRNEIMNVIQVPLENKMFDLEFDGELSNFIYDEFSFLFTNKNKLSLGVTIFFKSDNGDISGTEIHLVCLNGNWNTMLV